MRKTFISLLTVLFVSVQMLSFLHVAEYGVDEHEHNGQLCDVYLHGEQANYTTPDAAPALFAPEYCAYTASPPELTFIKSATYRSSSPRAPPHLS